MKLLGSFALLALLVFPQAPPDFSGEWVAVEPATVAGYHLSITQTTAAVTLRFKLPEHEYIAEYGLDGTARVAPAKDWCGGRYLFPAKWESGKLWLADRRNVANGPVMRVRRTLSFDQNGDLILEIVSRAAPRTHSDSVVGPSRILYRRR